MIHESVREVINKYHECHNDFDISIDTGYQILRYQEGGFYVQHTDSFKEQQRSVSCSLHLNDDYEGGNFGFFDGQMQVRA